MELRFDLWHLAFVNLIQDRAPPGFEVRSEVRLNIQPQRADLLLLRRISAARQEHEARVLRALWARLGRVTVVEYKSPVDSAFRPGDLLRLVGYGVFYDTAHLVELPAREDLTLVLPTQGEATRWLQQWMRDTKMKRPNIEELPGTRKCSRSWSRRCRSRSGWLGSPAFAAGFGAERSRRG